jgi:arylsulfatase A-like enzyme
MRACGGAVAVLCIGLVLAACGGPARRAEQPNVLLVTVDTLRADRVSSYGFELQTTPNIDALAGRGILFERAIAAASTTAPSHASIMTSRYTRGHSIGFLNDGSRLEGGVTLAEIFREHGYRTAGFIGNTVLQRRNGFDRGFDTYDDELPTPERNRAELFRERRAQDTTQRALAWLGTAGDQPIFLWVHYQDPHGPYTPPPEYAGRFRERPREAERALPVVESQLPWDAIPAYQAIEGLSLPSEYRGRYADEIFYADESIGRLVAAFEGLGRTAVVLLTADHGESLGEDGRFFMHGFATTPQLAHVPMVLVAPGLAPSRRRDLVHHVDVMPTLLDLAGIAVPDGSAGASLAALVREGREMPDRIVYCDIGSDVSAYRGAGMVRALGVIGAWSGPDAPRTEPVWQSYAWRRDGSWSRVPEIDVPKADVRRYLATAVPIARTELSPERIEELRALGYVVGH